MALHKIKEKLHHSTASRDKASIDALPSSTDSRERTETLIFKYRKQRGVNLGSWFVQERWICESTFARASPPAQSDLDIARGASAKEILESHWDSWIQENDWRWLAERGFNAVRIPIGYYHICGVDPSVLDGTDFKGHQRVFEGAWTRITRAIETAYRYRIGVLIDLHAAPGKQNPDSHSGTSNPPTFFTDHHNRRHMTQILCSLLTHVSKFIDSHNPPLPNLIGIELLNEPRPNSDNDLMKWYTKTIKSLRQINAQIPIYISDCWRLDQYADFIASSLSGAGLTQSGLVALDHHLYRCFTQADITTSAIQHAESVRRDMSNAFSGAGEKIGRAHGGLVVGEWSAALNPGSLRGERDEAKRYVDSQLEVYETTCAGWFFWTYKKQRRGDTGWSLVDAVESGMFPSQVGLKVRKTGTEGEQERRENVKQERLKTALDDHTTYWARYPGQYNHHLLEVGFSTGWDEAYVFFETDVGLGSVSELGFVRARASAKASGQATDYGQSYWEYEHGFVQGAEAARRDFVLVRC